MLLSVVIPTKNRPEFLKKILRSIYEQITDKSIVEVIVIDDGSSQKNISKNKAICKTNNFAILEQQQSHGSGEARNKGILEAQGKWIAFLDDDVVPQKDWLNKAINAIKNVKEGVVGIEGKTICQGKGLWDREVENINGNLYLTANIIYKKETIVSAGFFDARFLKYGEDQEFAIRMKNLGIIEFNPSIEVNHLPRDISFKYAIIESFVRMRNLLTSEYLFYKKHPSNYCTIRHANTFWGTLQNTIIKHSIISLKRRSFKSILSKPFQALYLIISSLLEQFASILFAPEFLIKGIYSSNIPESINLKATARINRLSLQNTLNLLNYKPQLIDILLRIATKKRNNKHFYSMLNKYSSLNSPNILLRVDDIFLKNRDEIETFCKILETNKTSFLAAIKLDDLKNPTNENLMKKIQESGGIISIHGVSHEGKHGPYPSEILQLNKKAIDEICNENSSIKSKSFIPPFNAIAWNQIEQLSKSFVVICGGPETGRFTNHISLPVILCSNTIYFPSLLPYYTSSKVILKKDIISNQKGLIPLTLHLSIEKSDNYKSLNILLNRYKNKFLDWNSFILEITNG